MNSIVTLTLSPCIDKSTSVPELIPEKKLKCGEPHYDPGGGGINVARAITNLGGRATAVFPSGGYTGQFLQQLLRRDAVPAISIESAAETRENMIIVEASTQKQYRFGMPGAPLSEHEVERCLAELEKLDAINILVASGSLPPGVDETIYAQIGHLAKRKNAKFIVDTSGEALRHAINDGVYMIKPNLGELASLVGKRRLERDDIAEAAKSIINSGRCEVVVVSMAQDGAILVANEMAMLCKPPAVDRKTTVGAGDSMVAGIVYSLYSGKSLEYALRYGVACGTAATLQPGTALCTREDADRLFHQVSLSGLSA